MLGLFGNGSVSGAVVQALNKSLAVIEFKPDGTILTANENFCRAMGYQLAEIAGKHHSLFVESGEAQSSAYRDFWDKLRRGEFDSREYKRFGKGGKEIWIQASYNPIRVGGKIVKVVKFATDITAEKLKAADHAGKITAISRAQAVIEFNLDGTIVTANENFLNVLGYTLTDIQGRHHSMFVEPAYGQSADYRDFWSRLNRGEFVAAQFKRIGRGGKEVWIDASYNPIFDMNGKVMKVVKFATDITERIRAVHEIGVALEHLADGDLEMRIEKPFIPDLDKLRVDFNKSLDTLQPTMQQVGANVLGIKGGTGEIRSASDDLARRTEQQAASLEETAAALDEITTTVRKTADGSKHASKIVGEAKVAAEQSSEIVRKAIAAMSEIEKSSGQVSQIIGVIDEIAFQTNLLALNAGVEAARAGEAGRGFAVVASEVRALAQRSAEAAKEIKALISKSNAQVDQGVDLVGQTGHVLEQIASQVTEINTVVTNIAASTQEQSTALAEVNTAVNQMDQMTQQNAAMVEESTAATHSLAKEADELAHLIEKFRFGSENVAGTRQPHRKPAKSAQKPVPMLKTVGRGGPARARPVESEGDWQEF